MRVMTNGIVFAQKVSWASVKLDAGHSVLIFVMDLYVPCSKCGDEAHDG